MLSLLQGVTNNEINSTRLASKDENDKGKMVQYEVKDVSPDSSFLEMLDALNQEIIEKGEEPIIFDHDCREGICGSCSMVINGRPHGPQKRTTTCQLHMRSFNDGESVYIEPWRAKAFPVIKDLMVDRSAFDRVIQSGGYVSTTTGGVEDANSLPIYKGSSDTAMDAAECIGCGACVAACKNASGMLFVSAKVSHLSNLPQGEVEAARRVKNMVSAMDKEGFGNCTNTYACQASCPKDISVDFIANMNKEFLKANIKKD